MTFFDKIKRKLSKICNSKPQFDPSRLNDELATKIQWTPAKRGGTNICTHSLKEISPGRMEFKIRAAAVLFPGIFLVIGIVILISMTIEVLKQDTEVSYFGFPFGIVFFLIGFFILRKWMIPRVFDRNIGYYWKGKNEPDHHGDMQNMKEYCRLTDIHAIQLLREYCRSSSSNGRSNSYYSYELNLVLKDGTRLNVVDHGKLSLIRADSEKLSQFLGIPVWDSTL